MDEPWSWTVPDSQGGSRLDKFILQNMLHAPLSRGRLQEWIREGRVQVDGVPCLKPGQRLEPGQRVDLRVPAPKASIEPVSGKLHVVYSDSHLAVLNKPAGLSVHPAPSQAGTTLVHHLLYAYPQLQAREEQERAGIVHRLDKDTTGLILIALTPEAEKNLALQFARRQVDKKYLALVQGFVPKEQGRIHIPLGRDERRKTRMSAVREGREAWTSYQVLDRDKHGKWSLLQVGIITGRTHQIRVHLAHLGHPVLGDGLYGGRNWGFYSWKKRFLPQLAKRQLLHSWQLGFKHPQTHEGLEFFTPAPKDFIRTLLWLKRTCQRVVVTGASGCGKSSVLEYFREQGSPVFSADDCVHELYQPGGDGWWLLRQRFGLRFTPADDQPVDKQALLQAIMEDSNVLEEIMHLIHPLVGGRLQEFWERHQDKRLAVAEVPLWFESGMAAQDDCLSVGVFCPDGLRRERLRQARGWESPVLERLEKMQLKQRDKLRKCGLVLDNSGGLEELRARLAGLAKILGDFRIKKQAMHAEKIREITNRP